MARKSFKIASGGHIKAKRIAGCECCNFMELITTLNSKKLKTGSTCPRCDNPTVRVFDSKAEFTRAMELKNLQSEGKISHLKYQPVFPLTAGPDDTFLYDFVADFSYDEPSGFIVEDVKGSRGSGKNKVPIITDVAKMKIAHFEAQYGIPVRIEMR